MEKAVTPVFAFTDFRAYLAEFYKNKKAENRRFSHRFIQEKVGASSTGWFSDVIMGRISLTGSYLIKLCKLLDLKPHEEDYFQTMVAFAQAASHEERSKLLEKMLSFKGIKADTVGRDKFEYYTKWYYAAIRELLFLHDFRGDYPALARKLNPPISPAQARKAIALLLKLGFIQANQNGRMAPTQSVLKKDPHFQTLHWANFQKANLELALSAVENLTKEERDISSLALVLSPEGFEKAREDIRALRTRLLLLSSEASAKGKVYQCNFQVFPVSN